MRRANRPDLLASGLFKPFNGCRLPKKRARLPGDCAAITGCRQSNGRG
jgi:hypothetical protein